MALCYVMIFSNNVVFITLSFSALSMCSLLFVNDNSATYTRCSTVVLNTLASFYSNYCTIS